MGPLSSAVGALGATTLAAALFGLVALRASGLGFLMITLAIGQVLWGLAFRWVGVTGGDNGISGLTRPAPFGVDLNSPIAFYYFALAAAGLTAAAMALIAGSAFGALLRGTRDQPRRMAALGHNVWLVRYAAFVVAGFFGAIAGLLFVYYNKFIHPQSLSLTASAEVLLMVIAGGSGTLAGPLVGAAVVTLLKSYVSAYVERWTMLLGFVFLAIVIFMPDGLVPGVQRLWVRLTGKSR
jgi:branched-chain amino acid transport system permease protein